MRALEDTKKTENVEESKLKLGFSVPTAGIISSQRPEFAVRVMVEIKFFFKPYRKQVCSWIFSFGNFAC